MGSLALRPNLTMVSTASGARISPRSFDGTGLLLHFGEMGKFGEDPFSLPMSRPLSDCLPRPAARPKHRDQWHDRTPVAELARGLPLRRCGRNHFHRAKEENIRADGLVAHVTERAADGGPDMGVGILRPGDS